MSASLGGSDTLQRMMDPPSSGPYYHDRLGGLHKAPSQQHQNTHPSLASTLMHHHFQPQQHVQMQNAAAAAAAAAAQDRQAQNSVSHVALEALAGSAPEKQQQQGQLVGQDRSFDAKYGQKCMRPECKDVPPFTRPCEYKKHKDKHDRPYVCTVDGCPALGFTYKGGLIRHEKEVHKRNSKAGYRCTYPGCTRVTSFTRRENFVEHLKRIHKQQLTAQQIENLRPSREGSPADSLDDLSPNGQGQMSENNSQTSVVLSHDSIDPSADLRPRKRTRDENSLVANAANAGGLLGGTAGMLVPNGTSMNQHGHPHGGHGPGSLIHAGSMPGQGPGTDLGNGSHPGATSAGSMGAGASPFTGLGPDEMIITHKQYMDLLGEIQNLKTSNRDLSSRVRALEAQLTGWNSSMKLSQ